MKALATIVLGFIVAIASISCLLCSVCGFAFAKGGGTFLIFALISLAVAIGGVMAIGKINRSE